MKHFYQSNLLAKEVYTTVFRILTIIKTCIPADEFSTKVDTVIKVHLNNLSLALSRVTDSTYVKILEKKDEVRDDLFIVFRDYCKAFIRDPNPTMSGAAAIVVNIIKELGWTMYSEGDLVESSSLEALFKKMEAEPAKTAITTLTATTRYADLKAAQADYEVTHNTKVDHKAQEVYPKILDCRKAIARYTEALLGYIDVKAELDGGDYSTAASQIDEVIGEVEAIAKTRETKNLPDEPKAS